jgi:hypothetical protein
MQEGASRRGVLAPPYSLFAGFGTYPTRRARGVRQGGPNLAQVGHLFHVHCNRFRSFRGAILWYNSGGQRMRFSLWMEW